MKEQRLKAGKKYRVVSIPSEGTISTSVSSVVNMVRTSSRGSISIAAQDK